MRIRITAGSNRASGVCLQPRAEINNIAAAAALEAGGWCAIAVARVEQTSFKASGWVGGRRRGRLPIASPEKSETFPSLMKRAATEHSPEFHKEFLNAFLQENT
jgi:hypothetical protein